MFSTARTFLSNFSVPCLYVALAGAAVGAGSGFYGGLRWSAGDMAEAKLELSEYRGKVAEQTAAALESARQQQQAAWNAEKAEQKGITDALRAGDTAIVSQMEDMRREITRQIQTTLAGPEWACLRERLPDDTARLFERPGT